jgi:AraC family transcriptional regulator of adaptative response / DNA-3-methyladenine glycosylase II
VDELSERVGIGSRQLRRLFIEHLGVPPIKIASTHRLHFARNLIEQTDMPMAAVALNAGYKSIRQFNHAVRTAAGQSPSELRRLRGEMPVTSQRGEFVMRLLYRPPFRLACSDYLSQGKGNTRRGSGRPVLLSANCR